MKKEKLYIAAATQKWNDMTIRKRNEFIKENKLKNAHASYEYNDLPSSAQSAIQAVVTDFDLALAEKNENKKNEPKTKYIGKPGSKFRIDIWKTDVDYFNENKPDISKYENSREEADKTEEEYYKRGYSAATIYEKRKGKYKGISTVLYNKSKSKFEKGGGIKNQYEDKSASTIWSAWSLSQRKHFLQDHGSGDISKIARIKSASELPNEVKIQLIEHVRASQYFYGGDIKKMSNGGKLQYTEERFPTEEPSRAEEELDAYIRNDGNLYRKLSFFHKNLMTKIAQKKFDIKKSPKLFLYFIKDSEKQYMKEFPDSYDLFDFPLTKEQKDNLAKTMTNDFLNEASLGNYENESYVPKKYLKDGGSVGSDEEYFKKISLGEVAYQNPKTKSNEVTIEIKIKKKDDVKNWETLKEEKSGLELSIVGAIWNSRRTDWISGGQNYKEISRMFPENKDVQRLVEIWEKYHNNDLKAGTKKQTEIVEAWKKEGNKYEYDAAVKLLKDKKAYEDKGYKYGHGWLFQPIPAEVITELKEIASRLESSVPSKKEDGGVVDDNIENSSMLYVGLYQNGELVNVLRHTPAQSGSISDAILKHLDAVGNEIKSITKEQYESFSLMEDSTEPVEPVTEVGLSEDNSWKESLDTLEKSFLIKSTFVLPTNERGIVLSEMTKEKAKKILSSVNVDSLTDAGKSVYESLIKKLN